MPKAKTKTKTELEAEIHDLWEKLNAMEEKIICLRVEKARLTLFAGMLKQVLQKCKNCGHRLRLIDFNHQFYIMACDYVGCKDYRTPVARINKEQLSLLMGEPVEEPKIEAKQKERNGKGKKMRQPVS